MADETSNDKRDYKPHSFLDEYLNQNVMIDRKDAPSLFGNLSNIDYAQGFVYLSPCLIQKADRSFLVSKNRIAISLGWFEPDVLTVIIPIEGETLEQKAEGINNSILGIGKKIGFLSQKGKSSKQGVD